MSIFKGQLARRLILSFLALALLAMVTAIGSIIAVQYIGYRLAQAPAQTDIVQIVQWTVWGLGITALAALAATGIMVWQALTRIVIPLGLLREGVEQLRLGQLEQRVQVRGQDEIGSLANAFNMMAAQLQQRIQAELTAHQALASLNAELEQRVARRTAEVEASRRELETSSARLSEANTQLQKIVAQNERRARLLEAAAQVARAAAMVRDPETLLPQTTQLISEHFGFYHAGVFLVDEAGEWAVLRAANSEGGQEMLRREHKLRIGAQGIVGWVAHTGRPRIALDTGADAAHFNNPLLPNTRSEMALPLKAGERILGVLDVQSTEGAAFSNEDIAVLQTLADQLSTAIENARLFQQTQAALDEAQSVYQRYILREWEEYLEAAGAQTQEYAATPELLIGNVPLPEIGLAYEQRQTIAWDAATWREHPAGDGQPQPRAALVAPIKIRDQVIGVLDLREVEKDRQWTDDEIALADAVANQVGLAVENARLFEQTQTTLAETRQLYQASAQINAATTLDDILTALRANTLLGEADVSVNLHLFDTPWVDTKPQWTEIVAAWSPQPGETRTAARYNLHQLPASSLLTPTEPLIFNDIANEPRMDDTTRQLFLETLQTRSAVYIPLVASGQCIGTVSGLWSRPTQLKQADMQRAMVLAGQAATSAQSRRLFEQAQTRVRQLAALNEISRAASGVLESEQLLVTTYAQIQSIIRADVFYVGMYDAETQTITYPICYDAGQRYQEAPGKLRPDTNIYTVITTGEPVFVQYSRGEREQLILKAQDAMGTGQPSAALVFVPMKLGERVIGVMSVQSYEPDVYTQDHVNLLANIASQVAVALENARLFEQTKQQVQDLETINRVAQVVTSAMNQDQLLHLLHRQVEAICGTPDFYVARYIPERDEIEFPIYYERGKLLEQESRPGGTGLTGHVIKTNQPLLIHTAQELDALGIPYYGEASAAYSYLAVPLRAGERFSGVLAVQHFERDYAFDERQLRILATIATQAATALENARLFEEARHRALQLATAAETGKAASALLDMNELLSTIVELIRIRFNYYHTSVFLLDAEGKYAVLSESTGEVGRQLKERQHKLAVGSQGLVGWATSTGRSRVATDTDKDSVHFKNPLLPLTRSELAIPLKRGERIIGALDVQSTEPNAFSPDDVAILEVLADQLAIAIENARLYQAEQRRAVRQAALYDIGRKMTSTLDPKELMNIVVEAVQRDLGYERLLVLLSDEGTKTLYVAAASTNFADLLPPDYRHPIGTGLMGMAALTGQAQRANDTHADPTYVAIGKWDPRSELCLPLRAGARTIGVLNIESDTPNTFSDEDALALESLADQLAVALENARLYEAEQQRRREAAALLDVARVVGASLELKQLIGEVAHKVARAVNADRCSVFLLDEARTSLRPAASRLAVEKVDANFVEKFTNLQPERVESVPLYQKATATGEPVLFDAERTPYALPRSWNELLGARTALVASMVSKGQPIGIMLIDYYLPHDRCQFTPEQVTLAAAMVAQSAMVIANALLYDELSQTADRLREMDKLKSQFLANMSHELRTPLNSIIGFSRVILKGIDGPLTDMQKQDLTAIHGSGQHLLGLINNILDISKIEAGKMELTFELVDSLEIARTVASTAIGLLKDRPVELIQKIPKEVPKAWGDSVRTRQVLLNLVSNAAKFTEKGSITIEVTFDARFVRYSVKDTGIGIAKDKQAMIFEAFTQADASTTRKYGGTGLGLAISRRFVEMEGGEIWIESELGAGTTFFFTVPRAEPDVPVPGKGEIAPDQKIVLAIDDDPTAIALYRRYLDNQGYYVIGVSNSQHAVQAARRVKPNAIMLDLVMPNKDGWAVLQELRQDPEMRKIPVLICSVLSEENKGFSMGAADYLSKPVEQDALLAALGRLDGRKETNVLVIDDRPEDIQLIRRMLKTQPQFIVHEAYTGVEGIEAVRRNRPDIILLDLMMPQMDGFQVLDALKEDPTTRDIPVIVVTAKTLTPDDRQKLNDHILTILSKGHFTEQTLLNDMVSALARLTGRPAI